MIVLPYLGKLSLQIRTRSNVKWKINSLTAIFELYSRLSGSWSIFSHSEIKFLFFNLLTLFIILNATYYGKTKRHFKVGMCEHLGVSALTGKEVKSDNDSAIKEHHLFCNHSSGFDDFSKLPSNNNEFKVTLMESLLINRTTLLWIRTGIRFLWNFSMIEEYNFITR